MNKFTKVLASFCATAMIFGSFSATVFADEVAAGDQESSSEKPSDYYDAPSVREDAIAEGFESLDARVKRIEAENNDTQSGNDDTQAGVDDDYPEGYGIPGVNGSQAGTNGDQAGADEPKVAGYQLVIAGDIKLRAALNLGTFAEDSTSVTYSYSYTKDTKTVNVEKTVNYSDFGTYESYRTVDIPVESACITSPITLTINYGTDGHVTKDPVTVDQYITNVMHGDFDDKIKAVAYSIRDYGSFAMMQFNINMNDPALRPASEEINASLYDPQTVILQKYLIGDGALYAPANDPDEAFYGASVSFLSKTEVNMYFKKSVLGTTAPKMTVTYSNGKEETISATENGSYYVYTVKGSSGNGFTATKFDVPFSYSVGNVSGEYSVNTYLQVVEYKFHGESSNITLKLAEAYYDFARKCQQL